MAHISFLIFCLPLLFFSSFGLSDTIFLYPGTTTLPGYNAYLGEQVEAWEQLGGKNAFHDRVTVRKLETRINSDSILLGTLTSTV